MDTLSSTAQASLAGPARAGEAMTAVSEVKRNRSNDGFCFYRSAAIAQPAVKRSMPAAIAIFAFLALLLVLATYRRKRCEACLLAWTLLISSLLTRLW